MFIKTGDVQIISIIKAADINEDIKDTTKKSIKNLKKDIKKEILEKK